MELCHEVVATNPVTGEVDRCSMPKGHHKLPKNHPDRAHRLVLDGDGDKWFETQDGKWPEEEQAILAEIAYFFQQKPMTEIIACYADGDDLKTMGGDDIGWTVEVILRWIPLPTPGGKRDWEWDGELDETQ